MERLRRKLAGLTQHELRSMLVDPVKPIPLLIKELILNEIKFVCSAPSQSGGRVAVDVVDLDLYMAKYWHKHIQPIINQNKSRTDCGWDWRKIYIGSTALGSAFRQSPDGLVIAINMAPKFAALVPVAMLQMANNYPHFMNHGERSSFVWYLTQAPVNVLRELKDPASGLRYFTDDNIPKNLGSLALDCSIIMSLLEENDGRLGLHAAPQGGQDLIDWYEKKGMINVPASDPLPRGFRHWLKGNDGRYFCYNIDEALEAAKEADNFR